MENYFVLNPATKQQEQDQADGWDGAATLRKLQAHPFRSFRVTDGTRQLEITNFYYDEATKRITVEVEAHHA